MALCECCAVAKLFSEQYNNKLTLASLPAKPALSCDPLSAVFPGTLCAQSTANIPVPPPAPVLLPGRSGGQSLPLLPPGWHQFGSHSCLTTRFDETYGNLASLESLSRPNLIKNQPKKSLVEERTGRWEKADTMPISKAHSLGNCRRRFLGLRQVQVQRQSSVVPLCVDGGTTCPRQQGVVCGLSNVLSVCQEPQALRWIYGSADC